MNRTYHIEKELGSGGSGAVYLAWHKRLRKHVVIKVVKNNGTGTIEVRRNEVEALKKIKNMHIPLVLDFLTENNYSFTVMEYIEGESFDKIMKYGHRFSIKKIITWYFQLASALNVIHEYDICHRDIKPANIMLTKNGDVCLIDFNSALVTGNNTGIISRSMGYASPEQYEYFKLCRGLTADAVMAYSDFIETILLVGDCRTDLVSGLSTRKNTEVKEIDWKLSDIYSLAATMYHFMTGKRPPVKADEIAKISNLNGYPKSILTIIEKSMRTNPHERYASAEEIKNALRKI